MCGCGCGGVYVCGGVGVWVRVWVCGCCFFQLNKIKYCCLRNNSSFIFPFQQYLGAIVNV